MPHPHDLAVWHEPRPPYAYPLADERIRVRLRTLLGDPRRPSVAWSDRQGWRGPDHEAPLRHLTDDDTFRYWEADIAPIEGRVRYIFRLADLTTARSAWLGEDGLTAAQPGAEWPDGYFHWPYLHRERRMDTPDWVRDAICYEIFPDRFARGTPPVAPQLAERWPGAPTHDAFWGGDLRGILDHVGFLAGLGVNLLWLTPIFEASTNHKYDTTDYGRVDPHFGDDALFARLVGACRQAGIRIILDGVFNHSGVRFAPWKDVLERGAASPYWGWFDVHGERPDQRARNYRTFAQTAYMPRLMTANPEVQAYLIEKAARWMRMGIAGWRLDVADEVDPSFWRAFRREMRALDPQAYLVGEIGYNSARWLEGDQFDGVMHYPVRQTLMRFLAPPPILPSPSAGQTAPEMAPPGAPPTAARLDAPGFLAALGRLRAWYPGWATTAALNALSTHDVPRFLTAMGGDKRRYHLGLAFLLTFEGIPQLYYGDEVGMGGGYDPDNRRPMLWDPAAQDADLLAMTKRLVALRREHPALRASGFRPLPSGSPHVAAYLRGTSGTEEVGAASCPPGAVALVALNAGEGSQEITLDLATPPHGGLAWPESGRALDVLSGAMHTVDAGVLRLRLDPLAAAVLVPTTPQA